jgi:hypothetical protein
MEKKNKIEPKFKPQDYIINRVSGDMGIVKGITKRGYYQFSAFRGGMFKDLKDVKNLNYDLQVHYQKFYDICTEEEKKELDDLIKEKGEK